MYASPECWEFRLWIFGFQFVLIATINLGDRFVGVGRSGVPCTTANQCKTMHAGQPSARPSLAGVELERVCSYHGLGTNPDH